MTIVFRYLVSAAAILSVAFWIFPYFDYEWLSEEELTILSANYYGSVIPLHNIIDWALFISWISLYIGLWLFIRAARLAFLLLVVVTSVANFFWGFSVMTAYEFAIQYILTLVEGAILAMAYLTPVKSNFEIDS